MARSIELADHDILDALAEGGMGSVYRVRHRPTGELRVAKVVHGRWRGDPRVAARLEREARLLSSLRHRHLARLLEADIGPGRDAVLVMEHVAGAPLDEVLRRRGRLSVALAVALARQLAEALAHLHGAGWIHRDISPDNVMVGWRGDGPHATLIDLGIAKSLAGASVDLTATGGFVGKVRYSSPEQLSAGDALDGRSDLYALGLLLYEMLTGRSPIAGDGPESLLAGHLLHPPRPFDGDDVARVPPALRSLVMAMLAKDREQRPADADAVRDQLAALPASSLEPDRAELAALRDLVTRPDASRRLAPGDVTATVPRRPAMSTAVPSPHRRPASVTAGRIAALALALAVALAAWLGPWTDPPPASEEVLEEAPSASGNAASGKVPGPFPADTSSEPPPVQGSQPRPPQPQGLSPSQSGASQPGASEPERTDAEGPGTSGAGAEVTEAEVPGTSRAASGAGAEVTEAEVPGTSGAEAEVPGTSGAGVEAEVPGTSGAGAGAEVPGTSGPEPSPSVALERSAPAAGARDPQPGWLVLDVAPWAALVSITGADGVELPLPARRTTPLAVSLLPGVYAVTLRHPDHPLPLTASVEVTPGGTARRHLALPSLTVDAFLDELGG